MVLLRVSVPLLVVALIGGVAAWDNFQLQQAGGGFGAPLVTLQAGNVATDGEMHWLRVMYNARTNAHEGGGRLDARLVVGPAAIGARAPVDGFPLDPAQPPLAHADMAAFLALAGPQRAWVTAQAAVFNGWAGPFANAGGVNDAHLTGCHATIIDAMVATGHAHGGDNNARGLWQLGQMGGGIGGDCTINEPLARVRLWTDQIANHLADWNALVAHYTALTTYVGNGQDVWVLRGWLYATERGHGHRLLGSTGFAALNPGADIAAERRLIKMADHGGARHWGLIEDTAGHVRPRALGGERDAMNFVPQSNTGQKIVNTGERLAMGLADAAKCMHAGGPGLPANSVRYGVYFTYGANVDRRPSQSRPVVDLLADCDPVASHYWFGLNTIAAASPLLNWNVVSY